jgi:hypothetical protein
MRRGYYFIRFLKNCYGKPNKFWTIGYRGKSNYKPWECVGSDEIFGDDELEIGPEVVFPVGYPIEKR